MEALPSANREPCEVADPGTARDPGRALPEAGADGTWLLAESASPLPAGSEVPVGAEATALVGQARAMAR
eukprot:11928444-Alexandrium_andersonii.AAC.1